MEIKRLLKTASVITVLAGLLFVGSAVAAGTIILNPNGQDTFVAQGGNLHVSGNFSADGTTALHDVTTTESTANYTIDGDTVYVKKIVFGALPDTTSKNVAHGVTGLNQVIEVKGWLEHTSNGSRFPLAYVRADAVGNQVQLSANDTSLTATTATDWSSFSGNFYLYYTKD